MSLRGIFPTGLLIGVGWRRLKANLEKGVLANFEQIAGFSEVGCGCTPRCFFLIAVMLSVREATDGYSSSVCPTYRSVICWRSRRQVLLIFCEISVLLLLHFLACTLMRCELQQ